MRFCQNLVSALVLATVVHSLPATAMTVAPMQVELVSVGSRSHAQISVINNSDRPLPIEAVLHRLSVNEAGRQATTKAGEELLVMPPQALIPPGATQNFRVQWLGEPMMDRSQSFLLYMNQIPVKFLAASTAVQVVMSMGVMINVAPAQGAPAMHVVSTGIVKDKSGKRFPTITVHNSSKVHALLPQSSINLSSGNWSAILPAQSVGDSVGIGLVQPGQRRQFKLPVELPANVSTVQASLEMTEKRRR